MHSWFSPHKLLPKTKVALEKEKKIKAQQEQSLKLKQHSAWYQYKMSAISTSATGSTTSKTIQQLLHNDMDMYEKLVTMAIKIYKKRMNEQEEQVGSDLEKELLIHGTSSDKIATLTLLISKNPLFSIHLLEQLLDLCNSNNSRASELAVTSTKDLFINHLLVTDTPLLFFRDQIHSPFHEKPSSIQSITYFANQVEKLDSEIRDWLFYAYFEDLLKKKFIQLIQILKQRSSSNLYAVKVRALRDLRDLLRFTYKDGEERSEIIHLLIQHFGEKNKKIGTRVMHYLLSVMNQMNSPYFVKDLNRKMVVEQVESFCLQQNDHIKFYAIVFLNRIELLEKIDQELAQEMSVFYLKMCETLFTKSSQTHLMQAVLVGLYRALKCCQYPMEDKYRELLFKLSRVDHFANALEACKILFTLLQTQQDEVLQSRFMTILYDKILSLDAIHSSKLDTFLTLLFKSICKDANQPQRQYAFVKRLCQSCFIASNAAYTSGVLLLIKNIMRLHPLLGKMVFKQATSEETKYDMTQPSAMKSQALSSLPWEFAILSKDFHPFISKFGMAIGQNKRIQNYQGNPLEDFTLGNFLNRFMSKKPKRHISINPAHGKFVSSAESSNHLEEFQTKFIQVMEKQKLIKQQQEEEEEEEEIDVEKLDQVMEDDAISDDEADEILKKYQSRGEEVGDDDEDDQFGYDISKAVHDQDENLMAQPSVEELALLLEGGDEEEQKEKKRKMGPFKTSSAAKKQKK